MKTALEFDKWLKPWITPVPVPLSVLVVTGASEGIGRAYAFVVSDCLNSNACLLLLKTFLYLNWFKVKIFSRIGQIVSLHFTYHFPYPPLLHYCDPQLAEQGMNVVIMSRTKVTLDQVAKEISKNLHFIFTYFIVYACKTLDHICKCPLKCWPHIFIHHRWHHRAEGESDSSRLHRGKCLQWNWGWT